VKKKNARERIVVRRRTRLWVGSQYLRDRSVENLWKLGPDRVAEFDHIDVPERAPRVTP
jgi:hypothetical protein